MVAETSEALKLSESIGNKECAGGLFNSSFLTKALPAALIIRVSFKRIPISLIAELAEALSVLVVTAAPNVLKESVFPSGLLF